MHRQEDGGHTIEENTFPTNYRSESIECLRLLQDELKREFLLLEREQRQKSKIKKEIQHTIQQYYSVLVEKKGVGTVITEDKLSNSYNFVKDIVLSISKDVRAGFEVLMMCTEETAAELSELLLGMFYENFNENDPYFKKNTVFAEILGKKVSEEVVDQNFMKKQQDFVLTLKMLPSLVQLLVKQFCKLQGIKQYFEMLANRVLNKIPHSLKFSNGISRGSVCSPEVETVSFIETNQLNQSQSISINRASFQSVQQKNEINVKIDEAVEEYKSDILNKAEMMPVCLRVLCFTIFQELQKTKRMKKQTINKFIWEILQEPYFRPFDQSNPNKWNHFKNSYFADTVHKIQESMSRKADTNFLDKLVQKIINISRQKLTKKSQEIKKKIVIHGGCVSYKNLYNLFVVIKNNQKHIKSFNERITNRAGKIHQMNPNFDFFKSFSNPSTSYLVFTELIYGESLEKDYHSLYSSIYNDHKIKNMLKQILSDNTFHILPYIQRQRFLQDVLKKIIEEQEIEGEGSFSLGALQHSQQFIMKIKFLVYLMEKDHIDQNTIFCEMIQECVDRQSKNIQLFEQNKILLLQCLTTVSKAKKLVKVQKQVERNVEFHLKIVKILDTMQEVNLCITGASTRPEKEKYTKVGHRSIMIQNSMNCQHQENIEEGLKHHASNVQDALLIYCELREVKAAIESGKDIFHVYEALSKILDSLKEKCRNKLNISMEEYNYFESSIFKVVMRQIHENLLENKEKSNAELQFQKQLKDLAFIKPNKIKIPGRQNLAELEQVWEIACRYLKNINEKKTPNQKIESIMEMIEVIKISLRKEKNEKEESFDKHSIEIVLAYCLIRSKPEKILSNINFIQIFLSKDKLLSKEGGALERLKIAVTLIREHKLIQFLLLDGKEFEDQLLKNETVNKVKDMRENQKLTSLIAYI